MSILQAREARQKKAENRRETLARVREHLARISGFGDVSAPPDLGDSIDLAVLYFLAQHKRITSALLAQHRRIPDTDKRAALEEARKAFSAYKAVESYLYRVGQRLRGKDKKVRGVGPREYLTWDENLAAHPELAAEWNQAGGDPSPASEGES
jgi:hypothetical protein